MRIVKRITEVYREGGMAGVANQTRAKLAYWHRRATFRPHVIQKTLAGHTFTVAINNLFAQGWIEERERWPELEWLQQNFLCEGDFVVDCGANIGFTTIFFAYFAGPSGRVVAFEPFPPNVDDIRRNVALNGFTNVEIHEKAAGSRNGTANLAATSNGILTPVKIGRTIDVDVVRLDDAIAIGMPTLLKIDVEGHELEVLKGASRILASKPKLDIEVHPLYVADRLGHCRAIFDITLGHGYEVFIQRQIDAPIESMNFTQQALEDLATQPVFHVYARVK